MKKSLFSDFLIEAPLNNIVYWKCFLCALENNLTSGLDVFFSLLFFDFSSKMFFLFILYSLEEKLPKCLPPCVIKTIFSITNKVHIFLESVQDTWLFPSLLGQLFSNFSIP